MSWFTKCITYLLIWICHAWGQAKTDTNCECVPFYLCINGTINTKGEGIIDIRMKDGAECTNYLETCCSKQNIIEPPLTKASIQLKKCGYRNADGVGYRITGDYDNEAQFGEFPWMIAVLHQDKNSQKYEFKCGGTLIHPQVVLTAAHCITGGTNFKIRAGEWDSQTTQEIFKHQDRQVTSAVVHRGYKKRNLANDIALLVLDIPIKAAAHINVVCLPPVNSFTLYDQCFVTGWGRDKFEQEGFYQNILKRIELSVVGYEKCQKDFRATRLGSSFNLDRSFMCAGGEEGKDACTGDGGGPLVCPIPGQEDRYFQVGIVSWGIGCGTKGVPGAYADVARLRSWIDEQMNKRNFNISIYQA